MNSRSRPATFFYVRLSDGRWLATDEVPYQWTHRESARLAFTDRAEAEKIADRIRAPWNKAEVVAERLRRR